jgi:hypothetical protein
MKQALIRIPNTRTPTFRFTVQRPGCYFSDDELNILVQVSEIEKKNSRVILSPQASSTTEMIIFQRRSTWFWPKKNASICRHFVVLAGKLCVACFSDCGKKIENVVILDSSKNNFSFRVSPDTFHVDFPITSTSLHLEVTEPTNNPHIFLDSQTFNRKNLRNKVLKYYRSSSYHSKYINE